MIIDHKQEQLICWFPEERLTRENVLDYFSHLKACDWGTRAHRFCDFSKVAEFAFNYRGLAELAEYRQRVLRNHSHLKLVLYSKSPLGYGMARMYQLLMSKWPLDILVTQDLEEARQHLHLADAAPLHAYRNQQSDLRRKPERRNQPDRP